MYWYYKAPVIIITALLGIGIVSLVWRSLPDKVTDPFSRSVEADGGNTPAAVEPKVSRTNNKGAADTTAPGAADNIPSQSANEIEQLLDAAEIQFEASNYIATRKLALKALHGKEVVEFDRIWFAAAAIVDRVNTIFMGSDTANPERQAYTVQPGDSLSRIAVRFDTSVGALQRVNGLDPTNPIIYPGNVLYTLRADWNIRVVKSQYILILANGADLYRLYRVGIGKENRTPVGTFAVSSKVVHPAWTPPGRNYPFGDPDNPLGTHWLGLTPLPPTDATLSGYGIHGTWEPDSIGTGASRGCIRMLNEDVCEVFDFIPEPGPNSRVKVVIED